MPRYWILCLSEDNYAIARGLGLIGMSEKAKPAIRQIAIDDKIVFFISKKKVDSPNIIRERVY
jgi:predicted RNA-binding protein